VLPEKPTAAREEWTQAVAGTLISFPPSFGAVGHRASVQMASLKVNRTQGCVQRCGQDDKSRS
jgi:hypothetical protein